jgi:hypothetical protein
MGEQRGRGNAPMHLARDPQQAGDREHGDRDHDELHRELQPEDRRKRLDQQIDPEIADHLPVEIIPVRKPWVVGNRELDAIPAHMSRQID